MRNGTVTFNAAFAAFGERRQRVPAHGLAPDVPADASGASAFVSISLRCCLRAHKPFVPCTRCIQACPVDAVTLTSRSAAVSAACLGCGLCAADCPTGAIAVRGFDRPPARSRPLRIECARVPAESLAPESWVVPCTGGLRIADVVAVAEEAARSDRTEVDLVDRDLCRSCAVSGGRNTIATLQSHFSTAIDAVAAGRLSVRRVDAQLDPATAEPLGARPARSRRSFLRGLIEPARRPAGPRGVVADRTALARLAVLAGRAAEARHYPAIALSAACRDHAVCAANCPTGALRRDVAGPNDEIHRMAFDAAVCVACGRCADVCPERALVFSPAGAGPPAEPPAVLRERSLPICPKCEDAFVAEAGDSGLCPACRKGDALFVDLSSGRRRSDGRPRPDSTGGML